MIISVDTQKMEDANEFGETLRDYCFVTDEYGGITGCYSTFKLRDEFLKVEKNSKLGKELISLLLRDCHNRSYKKEIYHRIELYSNGSIHLGWAWDGDGTLLIVEGDKKAITYDCKNDYEWYWV